MVPPILWLLLAALALVLGWTTGAAGFYWVGYFMAGVWLVGVAAGRLAHRGIDATRRTSLDRVAHGGQVTAEVTVTNTSMIPVLWLSAAESLPAGLPMTGLRGRVGPMAGRASFSFRYALHGARRGYYEIGPIVLRGGDLFGLSERERAAGGVAPLTVFPKVIPITHSRLPSRRPAGEIRSRQRVLEDPTQVIGVRPYQHGDGLRRVHWRATAHTGRLQSKLFEVSAQVDTMLALNLRRSDYPEHPGDAAELAELAITAAASTACHVLERRQRIGLLALGRDPAGQADKGVLRTAVGRERDQLVGILSALGRIELGACEDIVSVLEREKERWSWGSLVVVITPTLGARGLECALGLRNAGFEVQTLIVGRGARPAAEAAGLKGLGIGAMAIGSEGDISGLAV